MARITVEVVLAADGQHEIIIRKSAGSSAQGAAKAEELAYYYVLHNLPNKGNVSGRLTLVVEENENGDFMHSYAFTLTRREVARLSALPASQELHALAFGNEESRVEQHGAGDEESADRPRTRGTRQSRSTNGVVPGLALRQHADSSSSQNFGVDNRGAKGQEVLARPDARATVFRQLRVPDSVLPESSDHATARESLPCLRCAKRIIHDTESHSASNKDRNRPDLNGTVREEAYNCRKNSNKNCGYSVCQKESKACLEVC